MDTYDLVSRNAEEIVPEEDVRALADDPTGKRVYVGYEPSGVLHLGHMLTANKLIDLQDAGFEVVVLLADVHAYLNDKGTFEEIRETAERMREQFIAYGLDESNTEFVYGSDYQLDEDYVLDLFTLGINTTVNRAQRAMAEIASGETPVVSQLLYPLMQALDIVYLDVDLAVGGLDQRKVHMLARDTITALGHDPTPALHTPILADLETGKGKMSSSKGTTLSLEDSPEQVKAKMADAFCPNTRHPDPTEYGYDEGTELNNPVLELFEYHVFPRFAEVVVERPEKYGGDLVYERYEDLEADLESGELHPLDAKGALADYLIELMAPAREALLAQRD
jgi:tyrosyl-tRNA synthetase